MLPVRHAGTRRTGDDGAVSVRCPSALCAATARGARANQAGTGDEQAEGPGQGAGGIGTRVGELAATVRRGDRCGRGDRGDRRWASVGLAWLCAVWYFQVGEHFDPVRVLGPLAATALLAVLSAENQYAAEIPRDPQLRAVLEGREHDRLEAARDRLAFTQWRERDRFVQIAILAALPILTVAISMIVSWPDSPVGALSRFLVATLFSLTTFGLLVRWHVVWAERRYLDALGLAAIATCIAVVYALTGLVVAWGSGLVYGDVVRPLASLYICVFGPWMVLVLFSTRAFGGRGLVLALADRGIAKRLEQRPTRRNGSRAKAWVPLLYWLSVLVPMLPIVLSRSTMRLQRSRKALLIVGWVEIGVIVVGGILASVLLP